MKQFFAGKYPLSIGTNKYIMGILNVTPDSFSDGGKYNDVLCAMKHTEKMITDGADIIDVGAVSTRPFSVAVSAQEEWLRLKDILPEIRKNFDVPISVDTYNPVVAEKCLDAGADIINDINCFFENMLMKTDEAGIKRDRICLDAGFGFSKNNKQNIELLENYEKINKFGLPLLCALSRKRFIAELYCKNAEDDRDEGSVTANIIACKKGADIIRVHNVALHKKIIG